MRVAAVAVTMTVKAEAVRMALVAFRMIMSVIVRVVMIVVMAMILTGGVIV
jgi:hypothetical protein